MGVALHFGAMEAIEDFAGVSGEGCEDFGPRAAHRHKADAGFRVGLRFAMEDEVDGVALGFPARGDVVAIAARFAVVHAVSDVSTMSFLGTCGEPAYTIIVASNTILAVLQVIQRN